MDAIFGGSIPGWFRPQVIRQGGIPSARISGFPSVIQHDSPLLPEQRGGPLVDLEGRAIGVNIARFGVLRVSRYPRPRSSGLSHK